MAPCKTARDQADQVEFFRLMRRACLRRARERYETDEEDLGTPGERESSVNDDRGEEQT